MNNNLIDQIENGQNNKDEELDEIEETTFEKTTPIQVLPEYLKESGQPNKPKSHNRNNSRGFAKIFIIIPVVGIVLTGGYVAYTKIIKTDNEEKVVQANARDTSVKQLKIITDYINIRENKDTKSEVLGKVYKDEIYTIISEEETELYHWYEIKTANGVTGYIAGNDEYVTILGDEDEKPTATNQSNSRDESKRQLIIKTEYINIRKEKDTKSDVIGKVYKDEIYTIISEDKNSKYHWYEIETSNGLKGYISGQDEYVSVIGEETKKKTTTTNNTTTNQSTTTNTTSRSNTVTENKPVENVESPVEPTDEKDNDNKQDNSSENTNDKVDEPEPINQNENTDETSTSSEEPTNTEETTNNEETSNENN